MTGAFPRRGVLFACAAALAVRLAAGFAWNALPQGPRGFDFYGFMADHLLADGELKWAFYEGLGWKFANRGPLYPMFVAAVRGVAGSPGTGATIVVQSIVGALACVLPALLAWRWAGARGAVVAAWIAALWPYSVVSDSGLIEHVLYAPACMLVAWSSLRASDRGAGTRPAVAAGALCGVAVLVRVTFAPSAALVLAAIAWRRGGREGLRAAGLAAAAAVLVVLPWIVRNHAVTGRATLGTDGGRALWISNAPDTFDCYPDRSIDETERHLFRYLAAEDWERVRGLTGDECAQDDVFRAMALRNIASRPAAVAWGGARKSAALWSVVQNPEPFGGKAFVHLVSMALLLTGACAAAALVPACRGDLIVAFALAASFTVVAAAFWGQPRYLAPLHGLGIALVGAGVVSVVSRPR